MDVICGWRSATSSAWPLSWCIRCLEARELSSSLVTVLWSLDRQFGILQSITEPILPWAKSTRSERPGDLEMIRPAHPRADLRTYPPDLVSPLRRKKRKRFGSASRSPVQYGRSSSLRCWRLPSVWSLPLKLKRYRQLPSPSSRYRVHYGCALFEPSVCWSRRCGSMSRKLTRPVLPMIVTAMIMAIQRLRGMTQGGGKAGKLARWTIGYYVLTTIVAVAHSCLLVGLVWSKLMQTVSGDQLAVDEEDQETIEERKEIAIHEVVVDMFESLVPNNIVDALATDSLLAVLVTAVVIGYVIKPGGALMRAVEEVEVLIMRIITVLIYLAPIGVFHLIMPNLWRLDIAEIGMNLGILIGGTLCSMFIHLFVLIPIIVFAITRRNPYAIWIKCSPAWVTAWGTASSAATLPVTIRCVLKLGVPVTVTKFAVPLGCL